LRAARSNFDHHQRQLGGRALDGAVTENHVLPTLRPIITGTAAALAAAVVIGSTPASTIRGAGFQLKRATTALSSSSHAAGRG
jgi:hypothetical protein